MLISLRNLGKPFFTNRKDQKRLLYQKSYSKVTWQKSVNTKSRRMRNSTVKRRKLKERKMNKITKEVNKTAMHKCQEE